VRSWYNCSNRFILFQSNKKYNHRRKRRRYRKLYENKDNLDEDVNNQNYGQRIPGHELLVCVAGMIAFWKDVFYSRKTRTKYLTIMLNEVVQGHTQLK